MKIRSSENKKIKRNLIISIFLLLLVAIVCRKKDSPHEENVSVTDNNVKYPDSAGKKYESVIEEHKDIITTEKSDTDYNSCIPESDITEPAPTAEPVSKKRYILSTASQCIHANPECYAVSKILPENYSELFLSENELAEYANIYWACGRCCSAYERKTLPKF
ncbi:MAG: hypothetical protein K2J39_02200 [Ruminococcus sp.]|nr:hypothetical protein [Ruminococcus sp.]